MSTYPVTHRVYPVLYRVTIPGYPSGIPGPGRVSLARYRNYTGQVSGAGYLRGCAESEEKTGPGK